MSKVSFITGIAGQDGSYLAQFLLERGDEVHGLVLAGEDQSNLALFKDKLTLHEGNLVSFSETASLIEKVRPNEIYNLGGISSVAFSWKEPVLTYQVSGVAATNLMEAAHKLHQENHQISFVQASSSEIFGHPINPLQDENTLIAPVSPYGNAKALAHRAASIYRGLGLNISTVILFPHESPKRPETFVTMKIIQGAKRIAAGEQKVLEMGNMDSSRDWGYAPDYVRAMISAADLSPDEADDFVLATGETHTIEDFAQVAFNAVGITNWQDYIVINSEFVRPNDPGVVCGDASRAREVLGFENTLSFSELIQIMGE
jgi:GDPmannose 4,6-dehydratase